MTFSILINRGAQTFLAFKRSKIRNSGKPEMREWKSDVTVVSVIIG